MKTIKLKSISLLNFKGIKNIDIDFQDETNIYGANGAGKTTIFDAFTWVLFGKDSAGRTTFEIKPLDRFNNTTDKIDTVVSAVLTVDGVEMKFKRTLREKWVKKRGALEAEFTGNETLYEWNNVEMTQRDFDAKRNNIIDEGVFRLVTNPKAFNDLKWQDQRKELIEIAGGITNAEIAAGNKDFEALVATLQEQSITLHEYTTQIKASLRKSNNEIKTIPTRIDEVQRSKPVPTDFSKVTARIEAYGDELHQINEQITSKLKRGEAEEKRRSEIRLEIQRKEYEIKAIENSIESEAKSRFNRINSEYNQKKHELETLSHDLTMAESMKNGLKTQRAELEKHIASIDTKLQDLRDLWHKENDKEFSLSGSETSCPTCKREFEASKVSEITATAKAHFQAHKKEVIEDITGTGSSLNELKEKILSDIESLSERLITTESKAQTIAQKHSDLKTIIDTINPVTLNELINDVFDEKANDIQLLKDAIDKDREGLLEKQEIDVSELKDRKSVLLKAIDQEKLLFEEKNQIERANKRIEELEKEESNLAESIAHIEKQLYVIELFTKEKIDRLESSINSFFKFVSFKLFETQVNGAEVETCKALINGVPFSDANTASKINAGIDIINTLSSHYGITAPIFIDNRESVTKLIYSDSQIINLIVSEKDKELRIRDKELLTANA